MMMRKLLFIIFLCGFVLNSCNRDDVPFRIKEDLFDFSQPETLGLNFAPEVESFTVFCPRDDDNHYNHGVVLMPFKGKLYAQWQTSKTDEDAKDTHVVYSISNDGKIWSKPILLTDTISNEITTSGGWWVYNDKLVAFVCCWSEDENGQKRGLTKYATSKDGLIWSEFNPVLDINNQPVSGIIEQDLHALPSGRIITAFHTMPGVIATPFYTDDLSGVKGWKQGKMGNLPFDKSTSRELEPSWFYKKNGDVVMVFRDQGGSFKKLASVSCNNGETWTTPVETNFPDSRAKQSAGNFPDGTAFQINNPSGSKTRIPLVISVSKNGEIFNKAWLLRSGGSNLQPLKYQGKYKRVGYSYPKSVLWGEYLYTGYATNKEDVEITRVKWKSLE